MEAIRWEGEIPLIPNADIIFATLPATPPHVYTGQNQRLAPTATMEPATLILPNADTISAIQILRLVYTGLNLKLALTATMEPATLILPNADTIFAIQTPPNVCISLKVTPAVKIATMETETQIIPFVDTIFVD
jgi:hypothetical protein